MRLLSIELNRWNKYIKKNEYVNLDTAKLYTFQALIASSVRVGELSKTEKCSNKTVREQFSDVIFTWKKSVFKPLPHSNKVTSNRKIPFGYEDGPEDSWIINNSNAKTVLLAFHSYLNLKNSKQVALLLNNLGCDLTARSVIKILRDKAYLGERFHKSSVQSILSLSIFKQAQDIISSRRSTGTRKRNIVTFLFAGFIKDQSTGKSYVGYRRPKKNKVHYYYKVQDGKGTNNKNLEATNLERRFSMFLERFEVDVDAYSCQLGELHSLIQEEIVLLRSQILKTIYEVQQMPTSFKNPEVFINDCNAICTFLNEFQTSENFINYGIKLCENGYSDWIDGDVFTKRYIQKALFPRGVLLYINNEAEEDYLFTPILGD